MENAEDQALDACVRYLEQPENSHLGFMYAIITFCTRVGPGGLYGTVTTWSRFFGSENLGKRSDYIDLYSTDGQDLVQVFTWMRNNRPQ